MAKATDSDRHSLLYFSLTWCLLGVGVNVGDSEFASNDAKNGPYRLANDPHCALLRGTPSAARVRERRGDGGQHPGDFGAITRISAIVPLPDRYTSGSQVPQVSEK